VGTVPAQLVVGADPVTEQSHRSMVMGPVTNLTIEYLEGNKTIFTQEVTALVTDW